MSYTLGQAAKPSGCRKRPSCEASRRAGSVQGGMSSANGPSSPANCIGFTRPWRMTPARGTGTEERGVTGGEPALAEATTRATLAEARLSDFKSMLDDIREQRDRWQQQAERVAALAITDQRKEPAPAQPYSRRRWLRTPTRELLFLWIVGLMCGGVLFLSLKGGS